MSSNDYLWNLRLHMNVTKVEKFVQFIHGDESTQVDGFDTQNISSVFYAFEAFFNNYITLVNEVRNTVTFSSTRKCNITFIPLKKMNTTQHF